MKDFKHLYAQPAVAMIDLVKQHCQPALGVSGASHGCLSRSLPCFTASSGSLHTGQALVLYAGKRRKELLQQLQMQPRLSQRLLQKTRRQLRRPPRSLKAMPGRTACTTCTLWACMLWAKVSHCQQQLDEQACHDTFPFHNKPV